MRQAILFFCLSGLSVYGLFAECVCPIKLPIEVVGLDGTTVAVPFDIPATTNVNESMTIAMQVHNLKYQDEASLRINNGAWTPLNDSTVTLLGNAKAYGGIGGGFHTLKLTLTLPSGVLISGTGNTVTFRFNRTDGLSSGFRVLAFNIVTRSGARLIDPQQFAWDDVNKWRPPLTSTADIAAGKLLWNAARLRASAIDPTEIHARCGDCHTRDGSDLKYFNYSNMSIRARSMFHGLTSREGDQIASYIRTLNLPNPGRPWNPPYQPGPGLDSQPVTNWAGGAGIDAVLDNDESMIGAIFPNGFTDSVFSASSYLNQRETPQPFQYPDWNDWLPRTHPMDAFGDDFTLSLYNTAYLTLRSKLSVGNAAVYAEQKSNFDAWQLGFFNVYAKVGGPIWADPATMWTPTTVHSMMSLPKWGLVKTWELMHEFQLEGLSKNILGPRADFRAWYSAMPLSVSPHNLKMPEIVPGEGNGTPAYYIYFSSIWYSLQLILNAGLGQGTQPIDWSYEDGFIKAMGGLCSPQAGLQTLWLIKGLQISHQAGTTPEQGQNGWQPFGVNQISLLVTPEWSQRVWKGVPLATRIGIYQGYLRAWLAEVNRFAPEEFYAGGWTTQTAVPVPGGNPYSGSLPDPIWYSIPRFKFLGVDSALVAQWVTWAQTMWPKANWKATLDATCHWKSAGSNDITCSQ